MKQYQYILACVDLSPISTDVINRARELADCYDAHLVVLYANENMPAASEPFGEPPSLILDQELREALEQRAKQDLQNLVEDTKLSDMVPVEVIDGHPKSVILDYAEEHSIDLIILGRHQRPAVLDLLGSTANAVMHKTKVDVLLISAAE